MLELDYIDGSVVVQYGEDMSRKITGMNETLNCETVSSSIIIFISTLNVNHFLNLNNLDGS